MKRLYTLFLICLTVSCWFSVADAQTVRMPDTNLAAVVRDALDLAPNAPITRQALQTLTSLDAQSYRIREITGQDSKIKDLTGLEQATQLTKLGLYNNQISDIRPLAGLTQLRDLNIQTNQISDIRPLAGLTQLRDLNIKDNQISDITPLTRLPQLESLAIPYNPINNFRPLAGLTQLRDLSISVSRISDIRHHVDLTQLESLYISGSGRPISDLHLLGNLTQLTGLGVTDAQVSDLSFLRGLTQLESLDLWDNQISDLKPLAGLTQLKQLYLSFNQISDLKPLAGLTQLTDLGLEYNQIRDVSPLAGLTNLNYLHLRNNPIRDASSLANLSNLRYVDIPIPPAISIRNEIPDELPKVGKTLEYRVLIRNAKNVTGFNLTYQTPHKLTSVKSVEWFDGVEHSSRNTLRTGTLTASRLETGQDIRNVAIFPLNAIAAGEGELRVRGHLTTTQGRVNVDIRYPITIFPSDEEPRAADEVVPTPAVNLSAAGPKIEGPWLWMIIPTGRSGGKAAAASGKDYLSVATKGSVTEAQIATNGVTVGDRVKNRKWTMGQLAPTGGDNIMETLNAIGLSKNTNVDNHVAYGLITLDSPRKQNTTMYVGSDDAVKVWLNGELVHDNPIDRGASDYQESFPVTLKQGKNILLVAVYEAREAWTGFFGFEKDAAYSILATPVGQISSTQRPPLYWINAQAGTIHRLVSAEVENLVPGVQNATSLVLNSADNKIYWTEQVGKNRGKVKRANLDGSNVQVLANILNGVPHSIAVHPTQGKLYWTNSKGRIQRSNLNGKQVRNLIQNLKSPDKLIVDAAGGKLYWTETSGRIRRSNLNGKGIENIASGLSPVADIAISGNKLYWTEITSESSGKIGRANLNGSNFGTLTRLQTPALGVAIDAVGNKLYWSDTAGRIRRANLNGKQIQNVVSGLASPAALVIGSVRSGPAAPVNSSQTSAQREIPDATRLLANYPNPFNPETWIPYQLAVPSDVQITIYDARGTVVRRMELGHQSPGTYTSQSRAAHWDGRNTQGERVASGIYFYQLQADNVSLLRKMLILK